MSSRTLVMSAGLLVVLAILGWQISQLLNDPTVWPPDDFVEYWAAGKLALNGEDPYGPARLLELERQAGRDTDEAVMMWNPPWTLPVVMPLGLMPPRMAQLIWLFTSIAAVGVSTHHLGRIYGGTNLHKWVVWAVSLTFLPTYLVLNAGQIGPLLLLGAVGFLALDRCGRPVLAGAATVLLAIKPHLAYLLWFAIAFDTVFNRRWRIAAGGLIAGIVFAAIPLAFDPDVYSQYTAALRDHPPKQWVSLTMGTVLRVILGEQHFWLQFVPVTLGLGWFLWHWYRHGKAWNWADQTPLLLLVSFVTSPYGAWHFDLVLLLVPVLQLTAGYASRPVSPIALAAAAIHVISNVVMLGLNVAEVWSFAFAWFAPLALAFYSLVERPRTAVAA